ncbi:MAG: hypothetical protein ABFC77_15955 [Thermoguttaceae bacterium]
MDPKRDGRVVTKGATATLDLRVVETVLGGSSAHGAVKVVVPSSVGRDVAKDAGRSLVEIVAKIAGPSLVLRVVGRVIAGRAVRAAAENSDRSTVEIVTKGVDPSSVHHVTAKVAALKLELAGTRSVVPKPVRIGAILGRLDRSGTIEASVACTVDPEV